MEEARVILTKLETGGIEASQIKTAIIRLKGSFLQFDCMNGKVADENKLKQEFQLMIQTGEIACGIAIRQDDGEAFEREFRQLSGLYLNDFVLRKMGISSRQALLVAAYLLYLLGRDEVEKFHLLIHKIQGLKRVRDSGEQAGPNVEAGVSATFFDEQSFYGRPVSTLSKEDQMYVKFPVELSAQMTQGDVTNVLKIASNESPHEFFSWSMKPLLLTFRQRQVQAIENAYKLIAVELAMRKLVIDSPKALQQFLQEEQTRKKHLIFSATDDHSFNRSSDTPTVLHNTANTPSNLPKAGQGKVFASLARTSSTAGSIVKFENKPFTKVSATQTFKIWAFTPDFKNIQITESDQSSNSQPDDLLLGRHLAYAAHLERVVA